MARTSDCIIIGGGVIGLSVARALALDGLSVTVLERGQCGRESSWAGAGVLAPCNPHRRDGISELRNQSLARYPKWCQALQAESGIDPEYEPCGELEIALNEDSLRSLRENEAAAREEMQPDGGRAYRFLSTDETRSLEPAVSGPILGSLECRRTAQVRNPRLLGALLESCRKLNVDIQENTPAQQLAINRDRAEGVATQHGTIHARNVVLCAGAWSSQIDGIAPPLSVHPVRGQMILMKFEQRPFKHVIARGKTYLVPRRDGHVLLGATEEHDKSYSKRNTAAGIAGLIQTAMKLVPEVSAGTFVTQWTGLRPGTPDDNPLLGPVPGCEGLIAATGHYRGGLILAPITAEIVRDLVQGRSTRVDISDCSPGRFAAARNSAGATPK